MEVLKGIIVVVDTVGIPNKFSGSPSDGDKPKDYSQSGSIHNLKMENSILEKYLALMVKIIL